MRRHRATGDRAAAPGNRASAWEQTRLLLRCYRAYTLQNGGDVAVRHRLRVADKNPDGVQYRLIVDDVRLADVVDCLVSRQINGDGCNP
jgi:hypothetical protein